MQRGIHLAGGGALIPGVAHLLEEVLKLPVVVVPDPLRAVVRGIGIVLENFELYEELLIQNDEELSPQL
jgi:rod shape-determining protein MreB